MDMSLGGLRELVMDMEAWHAVVHRVAKSRTRLSDWTKRNWIPLSAEPGEPSAETLYFALCSEYAFSPAGEQCHHPLGCWGGVGLWGHSQWILLLLVSSLSCLFQECLVSSFDFRAFGSCDILFLDHPLCARVHCSLYLKAATTLLLSLLLFSLSLWVHALKKTKKQKKNSCGTV